MPTLVFDPRVDRVKYGGGSAPAPPATIASIFGSNLWGHYMANAGTFQTSGGSAAVSDTDPVGELQDQSGNARHRTQGTPGFRPQLRTGVINGLPVIRGDVSDDYLQGNVAPSGTAGLIMLVYQLAASPTNLQTILSVANTSVATRYVQHNYRSSGTCVAIGQRDNDTADVLAGSSAVSSATTYIVAIYSDGATTAMRINGVQQTLSAVGGANNGDWFGDTTGLNAVTMLAHFISTGWQMPWKGDWAEEVIVETSQSLANIQAAEALLATKWGVTL